MKLNLSVAKPIKKTDFEYNGTFTYIDPYSEQEHDSFKMDLHILDAYDDFEVEEIVALDVLEYYPYHEIQSVVKHWYNKLEKNGKLTISFREFSFFAKELYTNRLSLENLNNLFMTRASLLSMKEVLDILINAGFFITHKKFSNGEAIIQCQK